MTDTPRAYKLDGLSHKWGDYGNTLVHGIEGYLGRKKGRIQLQRTGPFIPPITFPCPEGIVVTDAFRRLLETSGLTGLKFKPVIKALIVRLHWQNWNPDNRNPKFYPENGSPSNYILGHPHCAKTAEKLGDLWELCPPTPARVKRDKDDNIYLVRSSIDGSDFFRSKDVGYDYVSQKAKKWLKTHVPEWVEFEEAKYAP